MLSSNLAVAKFGYLASFGVHRTFRTYSLEFQSGEPFRGDLCNDCELGPGSFEQAQDSVLVGNGPCLIVCSSLID